MAGRVCVRKEGLFLPNYHHSPTSVHEPENAIDEEGEHTSTKERYCENLSANTRLKEYGGLPVLGLVLASSWVGRRPVFGIVARKPA